LHGIVARQRRTVVPTESAPRSSSTVTATELRLVRLRPPGLAVLTIKAPTIPDATRSADATDQRRQCRATPG
jgi:hypothetical protein